jgi:hypothetical protein
MEDEEKSDLQISLGDFVSSFPLCCAFGVPELFFVCVRPLAGPQLPRIASFLPIWTPAPHIYMPSTTKVHTKTHILPL